MLYAVDTVDTVLSKKFECNGVGDTLQTVMTPPAVLINHLL